MTFAVYLPRQAEHGPVPVLWYLSGLTCTHANVMEKGEYRRAAEERDYDTPASRSSEAFRKSNVKDCFSTLFEKLDIPPDSDALLVQPVSVGS